LCGQRRYAKYSATFLENAIGLVARDVAEYFAYRR